MIHHLIRTWYISSASVSKTDDESAILSVRAIFVIFHYIYNSMQYKDFYNDDDLLLETKQELERNQLYVEGLLDKSLKDYAAYATKTMEIVKKYGIEKTKNWFNRWFNKEKQDIGWVNDLPDCPCKLDMSGEKPKSPSKEFSEPSTIKSQVLHPGAKWEIRSNDGQQCCYDEDGNLLTSGPGAGTADKVSPGFFNLKSPLHFKADVLPFLIAYYLDGNSHGKHVDQYIDVRPPNAGKGCPTNAS